MDPEQIGLVVGASLALQTALGPAMAGIAEAIKATGRISEGYSGMVSLQEQEAVDQAPASPASNITQLGTHEHDAA